MPAPATPFATIEEAIADIRPGKMVVVCDDEDRENEGDLMMAAQFATPEAINFMAKQGRGLICLALTRALRGARDRPDGRQERGALRNAVHGQRRGARGVTTGISAHDRARTIQVAIDPGAAPRPRRAGPRLPAQEPPGGVLKRAGHTEAAVDLARLAGLNPPA